MTPALAERTEHSCFVQYADGDVPATVTSCHLSSGRAVESGPVAVQEHDGGKATTKDVFKHHVHSC